MSVRDLVMLKHLVLSATYDHWITLLDTPNAGSTYHIIDTEPTLDTSDGFYFTVAAFDSPTEYYHLVKLSLDGATVAAKNIVQESSASGLPICIAGTKGYFSYGVSSGDQVLLEFNKSDLTHSATRATYESGVGMQYAAMLPDDAGNLFFSGVGDGSLGAIFGKMNQSTFVRSWSKNTTTSVGIKLYGVNASNSAFFSGNNASSDGYFIRTNSSGTVTWQKELPNTAGYFEQSILTASSNTFTRNSGSDTYAYGVFHLMDSSGTVTWSRKITHTSDLNTAAIASDGANYFALLSEGGGQDVYLVKLNSSGTVSFKRKLVCSSNYLEPKHLLWYGDNLYLFANMYDTATAEVYRTVVLCLPDDGTLTGTYVVDGYSFTYSTTTDLTVTTESHSTSTASLSFTTPEFGASASSTTLTTSTIQLTQGEVA